MKLKTPAKPAEMSSAESAALRAKHVLPLPGPMFARPIQIVEGKMQFLYDENGKEYLDGFAGVATVSIGHSHPHFTRALKAQIDKLQHNPPLYLHPGVGTLAKRLAEKAKAVNPAMEYCFFTNSGSEAIDTVVRMVRRYWHILGQPQRRVVIGRWRGVLDHRPRGGQLPGQPGQPCLRRAGQVRMGIEQEPHQRGAGPAGAQDENRVVAWAARLFLSPARHRRTVTRHCRA